LFEAQLHEIAAVPLPIPEVFFQSAYFLDSDRFVGLTMIKRGAAPKGRPLGTVSSHLWLDTRVRCGHHPVLTLRIRGGARTKACEGGISARRIAISRQQY